MKKIKLTLFADFKFVAYYLWIKIKIIRTNFFFVFFANFLSPGTFLFSKYLILFDYLEEKKKQMMDDR